MIKITLKSMRNYTGAYAGVGFVDSVAMVESVHPRFKRTCFATGVEYEAAEVKPRRKRKAKAE